MDFSSLFNYPDSKLKNNTADLVFLPDLSSDDWSKIFNLTELYIFKQGEVVINQGETNRVLYIIKSGSVEVFVPGRNPSKGKRIYFINEGSVFGEQSFFDGKPRSASVRGVTDGEILSLSFDSFEILSAKEPELSRKILFDLARILSMKLRQTTLALMEFSV